MATTRNWYFHALSAPWPCTKYWVRIQYGVRDGKMTMPVSHLATALGRTKQDLFRIMDSEGIPKHGMGSYSDGGILVNDVGRVLRSRSLGLNWTGAQIVEALSQLHQDTRQYSDGGAQRRKGGYQRRASRLPRSPAEEDAASSLESLAASAEHDVADALQSLHQQIQGKKRERTPDVAPTNFGGMYVYPPEWDALLADQIRGVHDLAMSSFRGQPNYEELKRAKRAVIYAELEDAIRSDVIADLEAQAKRAAIAEIVQERRAEISQQARNESEAIFNFHLP